MIWVHLKLGPHQTDAMAPYVSISMNQPILPAKSSQILKKPAMPATDLIPVSVQDCPVLPGVEPSSPHPAGQVGFAATILAPKQGAGRCCWAAQQDQGPGPDGITGCPNSGHGGRWREKKGIPNIADYDAKWFLLYNDGKLW